MGFGTDLPSQITWEPAPPLAQRAPSTRDPVTQPEGKTFSKPFGPVSSRVRTSAGWVRVPLHPKVVAHQDFRTDPLAFHLTTSKPMATQHRTISCPSHGCQENFRAKSHAFKELDRPAGDPSPSVFPVKPPPLTGLIGTASPPPHRHPPPSVEDAAEVPRNTEPAFPSRIFKAP